MSKKIQTSKKNKKYRLKRCTLKLMRGVLTTAIIFFSVNAYAERDRLSYWQSVLNNFRSGFYFEKFDTADWAKKEIEDTKAEKASKLLNNRKKTESLSDAVDKYDKAKRLTEEDYKTISILRAERNDSDDAVTEFLKLHPVGSNVYDAIKTLEKAGARCSITPSNTSIEKIDRFESINSSAGCRYIEPVFLQSLWFLEWRIFLYVGDDLVSIRSVSGLIDTL